MLFIMYKIITNKNELSSRGQKYYSNTLNMQTQSSSNRTDSNVDSAPMSLPKVRSVQGRRRQTSVQPEHPRSATIISRVAARVVNMVETNIDVDSDLSDKSKRKEEKRQMKLQRKEDKRRRKEEKEEQKRRKKEEKKEERRIKKEAKRIKKEARKIKKELKRIEETKRMRKEEAKEERRKKREEERNQGEQEHQSEKEEQMLKDAKERQRKLKEQKAKTETKAKEKNPKSGKKLKPTKVRERLSPKTTYKHEVKIVIGDYHDHFGPAKLPTPSKPTRTIVERFVLFSSKKKERVYGYLVDVASFFVKRPVNSRIRSGQVSTRFAGAIEYTYLPNVIYVPKVNVIKEVVDGRIRLTERELKDKKGNPLEVNTCKLDIFVKRLPVVRPIRIKE